MVISDSTAQHYTLQDPDVRLMLQVRDGNAVAFEELMLRYQNRVIRITHHLVGRRDLAEDLAQEVFMRVYRARESYKPGSKFSTWLFTITGNVASNALRTLSRRHEVNIVTHENQSGPMSANPLEHMIAAASGQMPTRQLDKSEMQEVVQVAINQLSERQRMAMLLSKFEHMSYFDIAEVMELTPQAVKSLLSRARCNLRDILEPYLNNGESPSNPK